MNKRVKTEKKNARRRFLFIAGGLLAIILLLFWLNSPVFFGIRYSLPYRFVVMAVLSAILCLLAFHSRFAQPVYGKILLVTGVIFLWTSLLLPDRINTLLFFLYGCIFAAVVVIYFLRGLWKLKRDARYAGKDMPRFSLVLVILCAFIFVLRRGLLIEYAQSEFPFWLPSLIAAISAFVLSVLCILLLKNLAWRKRDRIIIPVMTLLISFLFVWVALCVCNYSLDRSVPQSISAEICDKGIDSGGRGPTTYGLTLEMQSGDEIRLNVSQKAWHTLKKGDRITVFLYKGALNEPYYIYEESKKNG